MDGWMDRLINGWKTNRWTDGYTEMTDGYIFALDT